MADFGLNLDKILDDHAPTPARKAEVATAFKKSVADAAAVEGSKGLLTETDAETLADAFMALNLGVGTVTLTDTILVKDFLTPGDDYTYVPPQPIDPADDCSVASAAMYIVWNASGKKLDIARKGPKGAAKNAGELGYNDFDTELDATYTTIIGAAPSSKEKVELAIKISNSVQRYKTESEKWVAAYKKAEKAPHPLFKSIDANIDGALDAFKIAMDEWATWRGTVTTSDPKGNAIDLARAEKALKRANEDYSTALRTCGDDAAMQEAIRQKFHQAARDPGGKGPALLTAWGALTDNEDKAKFGDAKDMKAFRAMMEQTVIDRALDIHRDPALGVTVGNGAPGSAGGGIGEFLEGTPGRFVQGGTSLVLLEEGGRRLLTQKRDADGNLVKRGAVEKGFAVAMVVLGVIFGVSAVMGGPSKVREAVGNIGRGGRS